MAQPKGPHRDDYSISLSIGGAKEYGSDGQMRTVLFVWPVFYSEKAWSKPVLLVDDILGELDPKRKKVFGKAVLEMYRSLLQARNLCTVKTIKIGKFGVWNLAISLKRIF